MADQAESVAAACSGSSWRWHCVRHCLRDLTNMQNTLSLSKKVAISMFQRLDISFRVARQMLIASTSTSISINTSIGTSTSTSTSTLERL